MYHAVQAGVPLHSCMHAEFLQCGVHDEQLDMMLLQRTTLGASTLRSLRRRAEAVSEYHAAAVKAGGKDNGAPGHRAPLPRGRRGLLLH